MLFKQQKNKLLQKYFGRQKKIVIFVAFLLIFFAHIKKPVFAATVSDAPTNVNATAGNIKAVITFTAPAADGGSAITGFTATSSPGGQTGSCNGATACQITVSGLTNGTTYTFTVTATNAIGTSSSSAVSNSVIPAINSASYNSTVKEFSGITSPTYGNINWKAGVIGSSYSKSATGTFNYSKGVAIDSVGNLYVTDIMDCKIKKGTYSNGVYTWSDLNTGVCNIYGIAVDSAGDVYVSQNDVQPKIIKYSVSTGWSEFAGASVSGTVTFSNSISSLAIDNANNLYVTDTGNNTIKKYSGGVWSVISNGSFSSPRGVAVDSLGNIYVTDNSASNIKKGTYEPANGTYAWSNLGALVSPISIAVDLNGNLYVGLLSGLDIQKWTAANNAWSTISGIKNTTRGAYGIAADMLGNLYIAEDTNGSLVKAISGTIIKMRIRTGDTDDFSGNSWSSWSDLCNITTNGESLSNNPCVDDGERYVQYQAYMATITGTNVPSLSSVTISNRATYSQTFLNLISSAFDTGNKFNSVQKITWNSTNDLNAATNGSIGFQIRSAPDNGGGAPDFTSSVWCGPTDCSATVNSINAFATSYYIDKTGATTINSINKDFNNDRWIQYATFLKSGDGISVPPIVTDVSINFSFNIPPVITSVGFIQNSDGSVSVPYTLSETYDNFGSISHGVSGSPIKTLLVYQPKTNVTVPAISNVQTGIITINNPSNMPIPSRGTMLIDDELISFDSAGATGNQRNITARAQAFATSYPTFAVSHGANRPAFFLTTRKTDGSALGHTIDTLSPTGAAGAQDSISNTFSWDAKNDPNLSLDGKKLTDIVFKVVANDADPTNLNNVGQSSATGIQILDLESPKIKNLTSSTADGRYNAGSNIDVTINFEDSFGNPKNVTSTGAVIVKLETGTNDYNCQITSITNSSSASCTYQVQAGDDSSDLTAISVSGIIKDQFANQLSDYTIPAGQNLADLKAIAIDTTPPIISNIAPVTGSFINATTGGGSDISFEVDEKLKVGSFIKFTSTSGDDNGIQYNCTLQGISFESGMHSGFEIKQNANNCVEAQSNILNGSIYTMLIHVIDEAGNITEQINSNITFDTSIPTVLITAPSAVTFFNNVSSSSDVSYDVGEKLNTGTYLKFTNTGGSIDSSSPRICNLAGAQLSQGNHNNVDLNAACGGFALVDGAIYSIDMHAVDLAGNEGDASQKTNIGFDTTAAFVVSFNSSTPNTCGVSACGTESEINITATMSEPITSGSIIVRIQNSATPPTDVILDQISGSQISGTYKVLGPNLGHDTDDLAIVSIQVSSVVDRAGNIQSDLTIPIGQNLSDNKDIVIDTGPPVLDSFSAIAGSFKADDNITIVADYSETLSNGSTINITLSDGRTLNLSSLSGDKLSGTFTVESGENDESLTVVGINSQNAVDLIGNPLNSLILPGQNISNVQIDTIAPVLGSIPISIENSNGKTGKANPNITLNASDNFNLSDGNIYFSLNGGISWCSPIAYASLTDSFDITSNLCGGSITNNTKTITVKFQDAAGNDSDSANAQVDYDNSKPQIVGFSTDTPDGIYGPGSNIKVIAHYDENVFTGNLTINLNNGKQVVLNSVENGNTIYGFYTVGQTASDEDISSLRVATIVTQNVSDTSSPINVQTSVSFAGISDNLDINRVIEIDTTAPTGIITIDRSRENQQIHLQATDINADNMQVEIVVLDTHLGNCDFTGAIWRSYAESIETDLVENSNNSRKVCAKIKDDAGNVVEVSTFTPESPTKIQLDDISNSDLSPAFFGSILTWQRPLNFGDGSFLNYETMRCRSLDENNCNPVDIFDIDDVDQNYYVSTRLDSETKYCYGVKFKDSHGNYSKLSEVTCAISGHAPLITDSQVNIVSGQADDILITNIGESGAKVIFQTQDSAHGNRPIPTKAYIEVYTDASMNNFVTRTLEENDYYVTHFIDITGLQSGTKYFLKITATDSSDEGNVNRTTVLAYSPSDMPELTFLTIGRLRSIDNINESIITNSKMLATFTTNQDAKCFIEYKDSRLADFDNVYNIESQFSKNHSIAISDLFTLTDYDYKITCFDDAGITITSAVRHFKTTDAAMTKGDYDGQLDKKGPEITSVSIGEITGESVKITWSTNEISSSSVAYEIEGATFTKMESDWLVNSSLEKYSTSHSVIINNLIPATKYLFTVLSSDVAGNIALSSQSSFTTSEPSNLSSVKVVSKALGQAVVTWSTNSATSSIVEYGITTAYGQKKEDNSKVKDHTITLSDLTAGETYHFRVKGEDDNNNQLASSDMTFQPKSPPKITEFRIDSITEHGAKVIFITNVSTDSIVNLVNVNDPSDTGFQGRPDFVSKHEIELKNLSSGATFSIKLKVRDEDGNETEETFSNFTTIKDSNPPKIDNIKTDIAMTQSDKVQTIISWKTDELADTSIIYQEGRNGDKKELQISKSLSIDHVVVITVFKPGTVYYFNTKSVDAVGNESSSNDFALLTPKRKENIIQIITSNFQEIFKWAH